MANTFGLFMTVEIGTRNILEFFFFYNLFNDITNRGSYMSYISSHGALDSFA